MLICYKESALGEQSTLHRCQGKDRARTGLLKGPLLPADTVGYIYTVYMLVGTYIKRHVAVGSLVAVLCCAVQHFKREGELFAKRYVNTLGKWRRGRRRRRRRRSVPIVCMQRAVRRGESTQCIQKEQEVPYRDRVGQGTQGRAPYIYPSSRVYRVFDICIVYIRDLQSPRLIRDYENDRREEGEKGGEGTSSKIGRAHV